jgi:hypothetical protein
VKQSTDCYAFCQGILSDIYNIPLKLFTDVFNLYDWPELGVGVLEPYTMSNSSYIQLIIPISYSIMKS